MNAPSWRRKRWLVGWLGAAAFALASHSTAATRNFTLTRGQELSGWRQPTGDWAVAKAVAVDAADATKLTVTPGVGLLFNGPSAKTVHLVSPAEFGDAQIHIEFCLPKKSNSGVYVMGRYEVQIYDSFGVVKDKYPGIECGGIYPRWIDNHEVGGHSPKVNASKPPGKWQTFDITFRAPRFDATGRKIANATFVKVRHNGKLVHEQVEVDGPTRSALFADEQATGPLMLQGDHGPIAFRNIRVQALNLN